MAGGVGFKWVAQFANTYPGVADEVVADANSGYGDDVGGESVIVLGPVPPPGGPYYILMETSDYILLEDGGKIKLET